MKFNSIGKSIFKTGNKLTIKKLMINTTRGSIAKKGRALKKFDSSKIFE
jgi:hypothetical protein